MKRKRPRNPLQPLVRKDGRVRFRPNAIVRHLLDNGGLDMNKLALQCASASQDDWEQFYQLIGYSLHGFHELSNVSDATAREATRLARKTLAPKFAACRDDEVRCEVHCGVARED